MISSEYNWTDDVIFDLPICRLRQIVRNIEERQKWVTYRKELVIEWQTKTLATFIASTLQTEGANPLLQAVKEITLVDHREFESTSRKVVDERPLDEVMEKGNVHASEENAPGSMEHLMRGFRSS